MAGETQTGAFTTQSASSSSSSKWEPLVGVGSTMKVKIKPYDEVINFGIWQRRMRGVLVQSNLQVALLGLEKKPQEISDDQWNEIDKKAMSAIEMHVTDEVLRNLMSENNAKDIWTRLEEMYIGKSMSNKLNLRKQLFKLEMKKGQNLNKNINVFKAIVHDLEGIDVVFDEEDRALLLLASLPDSYDHFVTTLIFGKTTLKFNEVVKDL